MLDFDYEINTDDFDSADYLDYSEEFYSRDNNDLDYFTKYWYSES